jgi:predicted kinase
MKWNDLHSFYTSDDWKLCKYQVLQERVKEDGTVYCEHCGKPIIKEFNPQSNENANAMIFHHKKELTQDNFNDYNISLNPENIAIVHFKCHNQIHDRFQGGCISKAQRKVYIVHGAVCSGKSTFVKENMEDGDCVLDLDDIWMAVSGPPKYVKPDTLKDVVFALRNSLLEQIKMRSGSWQNAWVISTEPMPMSRKRLATELGAELIHIDTPKDVCLQRLYDNPNGRNIGQYEAYIQSYFDKYMD